MADDETPAAGAPVDPGALIRSRQYRVILVFAAIIGVVVSLAAWAFLELVHGIQVGVYEELPGKLGFDSVPWWWPLPWLAIAGLLTAIAITRLPGTGGHVPANGLSSGGGPTQPIELPGVLVAALATLGLGLVLGPEAPLIALGMGLGVLAVRRAKRDAPEQLVMVMAAAGSFAAISTVFGSPVDRGRDPDRGGGSWRADAAGRAPAWPDRRRPGLPRVHRPGSVDGAEHERLGAEPGRPAGVLAADRGSLPLGGGPCGLLRPSSCSRSSSSPASSRGSSRAARYCSPPSPG